MKHHRRTGLGHLMVAALLAGPALLVTPATAETDEVAQDLLARYTPPDGNLDPLMAALAAGTITTDVPPLAPGELVPQAVPTGYVIQSSELGGFDVTNTPEGQAEILAFTNRLRERGEPTAARIHYRVFSLPGISTVQNPRDLVPGDTALIDSLFEDGGPLGSSLVVPGCATIELVGAVELENNSIYVKTLLSSAPNVPSAQSSQPGCDIQNPLEVMGVDGPGDTDEWTPAGGLGCLERKQNNTAWFDPCSWWYHRTDDGIADRDTFGLEQYGTGKSKGVWTLDILEVQSWRKSGTADQDWVAWNPRADIDQGNCTTTTVGVNVNSAYLEQSAQICDKWDVDKKDEPADFANRWRGNAHRSERDTAMIIATSVPNGHSPHDYVDFDYYAT